MPKFFIHFVTQRATIACLGGVNGKYGVYNLGAALMPHLMTLVATFGVLTRAV